MDQPATVSILARPFERALPGDEALHMLAFFVSILARPFERALHSDDEHYAAWQEFQSSPALSSGRYRKDPRERCRNTSFNPRPPFRAGAT